MFKCNLVTILDDDPIAEASGERPPVDDPDDRSDASEGDAASGEAFLMMF